MRYPIILQHDSTDCGPAALAMVAAFHKKRLSLAVLREHAACGDRGTNVAGLLEAAGRVGFQARAVRTGCDALARIPLPAIAHWREDNRNHFVVLYRWTSKGAVIGDPARGLRRIDPERFLEYWTGVLVVLLPAPRLSEVLNAPSPLARLSGFLSPHHRLFLDVLLAAALMTILSLSTSFFIQALVDFVFVLGRTPALNWLSLGMLLALLARTAFQGLRTYLLAHLSLRIDAATMMGFHHHLLGLPLTFFVRRKTGEILSRLNDAVKIRMAAGAATLSIIVDSLLVLATAAVMLYLEWRLALTALCLLPLLILLVALLNRPMKRRQRTAMERAAEVEAQIVETVGAMQTIKACRAESVVQLRTEARLDLMLDASYRAQMLGLSAGTISSIIIAVSTTGLLWAGGRQVLEGTLTVGQLMAFHTLLGTILGPVERLSHANQTIIDALVAADRLGEILELETEADADKGRTSATTAIDCSITGAVTFSSVGARYGTGTPVFEGVTLEIAAGECVAIAGQSGCGKTTLVNLLARFVEASAGRVTIDGIDVRDYALPCLRREIAYVFQDSVLLNTSIADNIRMGKPTASAIEIRAAARLARVEEFALGLPAGYETVVGERGAHLSGGERQRVAIARAVLADAPILVLDEPANHLDAASERAVQDIIASRRGRRTTIVISHRPLQADRSITLEQCKTAAPATIRA